MNIHKGESNSPTYTHKREGEREREICVSSHVKECNKRGRRMKDSSTNADTCHTGGGADNNNSDASKSDSLESQEGGIRRKASWFAGGDLPRKIHWVTAGVILFSFAMPSGVVGVGYSIGAQGLVLGCVTCIVFTAAAFLGSELLLHLWLRAPRGQKPRVFGDFGKIVGGARLRNVGNTIQLVNFVLFMPVAFDLVKDSLRGVYGDLTSCSGLYTLMSAGICLLSTQIRSLPNATVAAYVTALIIVVVIVIQIAEVYSHPIAHESENDRARLFGNGETDGPTSLIRGTLGATAAVWAYVPAFLTAELAVVMQKPADLKKSLVMSASLSASTICIVGTLIATAWGWNVSNPTTLTKQWIVEIDGNAASKILNALLLFANITAYTLDSIPVATMTHKRLFPGTDPSENSFRAAGLFFLSSLPSWTLALFLAVTIPNLFDMLAFATALTTPYATMVYPACCYLAYAQRARIKADEREEPLMLSSKFSGADEECGKYDDGAKADTGVTKADEARVVLLSGQSDRLENDEVFYRKVAAWFCLVVGILSGVICMAAAVGQVGISSLRGEAGFSFC